MSKSRINIKRDQKPKSSDDFFSNFENQNDKSELGNKNKRDKKYTRQTFLISEYHLEKLRDFIHTKKLREDYNYTQKQALENALDLLFNSVENIESRPKH